ncbi:PAS domain S-box protein [Parasediminibacterium sp. JCM 36343]|uniref:PAS domain S-box protein n=1 Tax=Parasediminibacterium sp. JCM 36343 TaxID=3374279 RepID=UPI00397D4CDC
MLGNDNFIKIFNALPLPSLLLMPDAPHFTIVGANAAYFTATATNEGSLIGRGLFEVFPDNPEDETANGMYNITQSFLKVINTGCPHKMATLKYEIPISGTNKFAVKYWAPENTPVFDDNGNVALILNTVTDVTEKEIALQLTKESKQRYEYVTKATSSAIWDWDLVAQTIFWGEGIETSFGHKIQDIKEDISSWTDYIHPEEIERVLKGIYEVIDGKATNWKDQYRYLKADGSYAHVSDKGFVVRDEHGKAIRMVGSMRDITSAKEAEQHLKLLETAIANTEDIIVITNAEPFDEPGPRIIYVNDAYTKVTGYTREEAIGQSPRILQGEKTNKEDLKKFSTSIRKWERCEVTVLNYKKNGEAFWMNISATPIADEKGWFTHWVAIQRDVTLQKKEEQRLKLLESVITNSNDSIIITEAEPVDMPGPRIIYVNEAFTRMTGYTSDEVIGKTPRLLQGPKSDRGELKKLSIALRNWQPCEITTINYKKTGEEFWINFSVSPVADETGWFTHWISIERDVTERKQFEIKQKEAMEQQALFVSIVNYSDDAIISRSIDGTITSWNKGAEKIFGYSQNEAIGKHISIIIPPGLLAEEVEIASQVKKGKSVEHYETERLRKDGTHIDVSITVSPIFDSTGNIVGASKITRDITEKKKSEDEIYKSNERYNMVAKATNDAIWDLDIVTGKVIRSGNGFANMFGYPPEDVFTANDFFSLIHPDDLEQFHASQQAVFNDPEQSYWEHEYRFLKTDGKYAYVCGKGYIVRSPQGKAIQMIGATQDMTLQREHINEIVRVQQNLDSLINNTHDLIWSIDRQGKVIAVNTAFRSLIETITGEQLKEGDVISKNAFPEDVLKNWDNYYQRAFAGESFSVGDSSFNPQIGKVFYSIVSFSPIKDKDGVVTGVACLSKDITELKTASQKLIELNAQLEKNAKELTVSNKELEHFAFVASHDLQEPLRMVTSFLTLLEKKYGTSLDEAGKKYIDFAIDGAKRMRQIILDLLEFSRIGRAEESTQDISLNTLVNETLGLLKSHIEEKQATIEIGELPTIHAPKVLVRQVFLNLINNALKYTKTGVAAHIIIKCEDLASYWQFSVTDNGIGIKENYFERIFVIFQRLHNKDEFSGTGIGLAVTKKIITILGGNIWVKSKEGEGSTFYFTILKNR